MKKTVFHDRFDLDITLRDASLDADNRPTRRMIANAAIGMHVEDAYYSVREVREAVSWVHEGIRRARRSSLRSWRTTAPMISSGASISALPVAAWSGCSTI